MQYDCLMVEDDAEIAQATSEYLNLFGVATATAGGFDECLAFLRENSVRMLLLDVGLGSQSGFALCKRLRGESGMPILFVSARTSDDDVLAAYGVGGDDFIPKPYTLALLLAKVRAVLRRCSGDAPESLAAGRVQVDCDARRVTCGGEAVRLKEMEYKLLVYLLRHKNRVVPKSELLDQVWPDAFVGEGTLSVHIRRLREKLERDPNAPTLIRTVWGTGYILEDEP